MLTPRTWPDLCAPTPEQWLAWFLEQDPDDQLVVAGQVLGFADEANRCFAADHELVVESSRAAIESLNVSAGRMEQLYLRSAAGLQDQLIARDREIRRLRILNRRQARLLTPRRLP